MKISTAYQLPFKYWYNDSAFSSDDAVSVKVRMNDRLANNQVETAIWTFSSLARTGALSGHLIPPWESHFSPISVSWFENQCTFLVDRCRIADEALIVLAHMLLAISNSSVESVEVMAPGNRSRYLLASDPSANSTYPGLFQSIPFALENLDPEGGGYSFFISLQAPLQPDNENRLNSALVAWIQCILMGAYALAPLDPKETYVEPYDAGVTAYGTNIEWAVFKLRSDPTAINALINIFSVFHVCCQKIERLEIS